MRIALRPSVPADLAAFGIEAPPHRTKAITALLPDQTIVGIGGIVYRPDGAWATVWILGDGRRYAAALLRAARQVLAEARADGIHVVRATADPEIAGSAAFLARLGFVPTSDDVWELRM